MKFILERLQERSTWVGILTLLVTFGILKLDPEKAGALATALSAVVGVVLLFLPDKNTAPGGEFNPEAEVRKAETNSRGGLSKG